MLTFDYLHLHKNYTNWYYKDYDENDISTKLDIKTFVQVGESVEMVETDSPIHKRKKRFSLPKPNNIIK